MADPKVSELTLETLKSNVSYDAETGRFERLIGSKALDLLNRKIDKALEEEDNGHIKEIKKEKENESGDPQSSG